MVWFNFFVMYFTVLLGIVWAISNIAIKFLLAIFLDYSEIVIIAELLAWLFVFSAFKWELREYSPFSLMELRED